MSKLIQEKVQQAVKLLQENNLDTWLTFVRETSANHDPVLDLIYGHDLTWQSALILTKSGDNFAIVGHYESETAKRIGAYNRIIPYHESIRDHLISVLEEANPQSIAINYSINDVLADGITHGMYLLLRDYLNGTPWNERLVSAEPLIRSLRGRKTRKEISNIRAAISTTEKIYQETFDQLHLGLSEIDISDFMHAKVEELGLTTAWEYTHCPTVNIGPDSPVGHVSPTNIKIKPGCIVHFDFGIKQDGYCSDIQRVVFFREEGQKRAPEAVQKGFETVVRAIQETAAQIKPGMRGVEVDAISRNIITSSGYPEYKYATGHHVGQLAHDGAGILGPPWERYGDTPNYPIESNQVYTLEPGIAIQGYGYIGLEEMILVTDTGAEFLTKPQLELILR